MERGHYVSKRRQETTPCHVQLKRYLRVDPLLSPNVNSHLGESTGFLRLVDCTWAVFRVLNSQDPQQRISPIELILAFTKPAEWL